MDIETFNTATELYNRYKLCESVLENLTDKDTSIGPKFKELLVQFVKEYEGDFLMFVHTKMAEAGEAFEDLHCCPAEKTDEPTPPEDAKFHLGDRVKVIVGILRESVGTVVAYNPTEKKFGVKLDRFSEDALPQWYSEDEIEPDVESEEEPEEPTPPEDEDDKYEMVYGERVIVKSGEYAGKVGTIIDVMVGFTKILVGLDDVEDAVEFTPDQLAKYTDPEQP